MGEEPWGARGPLDLCGYMPLSLVLRINGEPRRALAVAERCVHLVHELRLASSAGGRKTLSRCLSAKAMALYDVDRPQAGPTLQRALEAGRDAAGQVTDGALLNIAAQLLVVLPPQAALPVAPQGALPPQPQLHPSAQPRAGHVGNHRNKPVGQLGANTAAAADNSRGATVPLPATGAPRGGGQWARRLEARASRTRDEL